MTEVDDTISKTIRKEFCQEALCSQNATQEERELMFERLELLFSNGIVVSGNRYHLNMYSTFITRVASDVWYDSDV